MIDFNFFNIALHRLMGDIPFLLGLDCNLLICSLTTGLSVYFGP